MARLVIDPISRIEGHLRIEVEITNGAVSNAWSTGTLFRGIETILKNRDPRNAWLLTQRLCGVCTYVHGHTSIRAVEAGLKVTVPDNARLVRNLMTGAQFVHDHVVHFYHLHLLDWVDVVSAASADPARAVSVDQQICPTRTRDAAYFTLVKNKLLAFVGSGQLGPFANGYWGHPAYRLTPEENLVLVANYLEAMRQQALIAKMHAVFGGKNPHPQNLLVGGVTNAWDFTKELATDFQAIWYETRHFVDTYYLPDATFLASRYRDWGTLGGGQSYLAYGEFPQSASEPGSLFFPRGAILGGATGPAASVDVSKITEHVARSWYAGSTARHPASGETEPAYTGVDTSSRYSWLKAPRYGGQAMEVGPLARVLVNLSNDQIQTRDQVSAFLGKAGLAQANLHSVVGRFGARAIETKVIVDAMEGWIWQLSQRLGAGNRTAKVAYTMATSGMGVALNEAPRGALGHWVSWANTLTTNYQLVVPSTWNFGPRDAAGVPGPVERSLVGIPVADPARPVEVLRAVHSFDPCIACAVHVIDPGSNERYVFKVS